jgi:hypothetical protein
MLVSCASARVAETIVGAAGHSENQPGSRSKNPKVELPEYVMCVRFSENQTNGYRPLVIGHNWPCIPLDEKGRDVIETTPQCIQAAQWEVYLPYTESLEGSLIGVGEMFAKKGRGFNLDQYMTKGKVQ